MVEKKKLECCNKWVGTAEISETKLFHYLQQLLRKSKTKAKQTRQTYLDCLIELSESNKDKLIARNENKSTALEEGAEE
jgi:hypothetical protein